MGIHRGAGSQQLFQHHVALQGTAFMAAITLGPGHAQPATLAELAAELGIGAIPVFGAFLGRVVFQRLGEKLAHLEPQGLRLGV
ncbi:hypothetical protein D3C76_640680 [compost metagenome]